MASATVTEKDSNLMTVSEVAQRLRVRPVTIYRALARGDLRGYRIGPGQGAIRIPREAVVAFCKPTENAQQVER